jgi:hypothetical protein
MPDIFISPEKTEPIISKKEPKTEAERAILPGHTHRHLSAFSLYPDNVDFETKESEEKIVLLLRQHPIVNLKWIIVTILMISVPVFVYTMNIFSLLPAGFGFIIILAWYLVTMTYALENFLGWYFNVYFVTDSRIIDVDFYNLVYKRVSEASINKIQDVSYTTSGVAGTVLDYGNVLIQTAAEVSEFQFESVPNPEKVSKIIEDLKTSSGTGGV